MRNAKIFIWLLFFIFVFVLFELGLFSAGRFLLSQRRNSPQGNILLVCLGDSHTFGVGTSAQYSYPKQEETLLNINNKAQRFSVVNLGIPGSSTKRQAQELESYLKNNYADIVIWLTGRNNEVEIGQWGNASPCNKIVSRFNTIRSLKFLKVVSERILKTNKKLDRDEVPASGQRYANYLNFYLEKVRKLCLNKGIRLVLLSYYNSSYGLIKEFANRHGLLYLDLTGDFEPLFGAGKGAKYISLDMSHLNHLGYKFFAQQLYARLFLKQDYLGFKISPLLQRPGERDFYLNDSEIERMIQLQKERIAQSKGSSEYPFELIHLGHIYTEIGNSESAKECYSRALLSSGYSDNNTIVSPIINWYLKKGMKGEALKICEEILLHNPENYTAKYYREWLSAK